MLYILHRRNTTEELIGTPKDCGVEIDLHSYGSKIVVHHDPKQAGIELGEWLKNYQHKFLIANVKQAGIESEVVQLLKQFGIDQYFLLDLSFPMLVNLSQGGNQNLAVRVSQFESHATALNMKGMARWIWLDLFDNTLPVSKSQWLELKSLGYNICLVSPELHGRPLDSISLVKSQLSSQNLSPDAICTKSKSHWE